MGPWGHAVIRLGPPKSALVRFGDVLCHCRGHTWVHECRGVFTTADNACPRIGSRLGDFVVDVSLLAARGFVGAKAADALAGRTLNAFMALGRPAWREVRARLHALFSDAVGADSALRDDTLLAAAVLIPVDAARMLLPAAVGDYTDFYSSRDHAYNVGVMFRGPANALQPNW